MESGELDAALVWNEAAYRAVANALPEIIWTIDSQGRLEWINDRWRELTGQSAEQSSTSAGTSEAIHVDDRPELRRRWAEALAAGTPCELEYRIRTRDGDYRWHAARILPLRGQHGVVARWVAAAFDIHERRQTREELRASERRFETLFNMNPQPIAVTRIPDGVYLSVNDSFVKMTGYAREDVLGRNSVELGIWTPEQRDEIFAKLSRAAGAGEVEMPYQTKNGRVLRLMVRSARFDFDGEPCLVNVSTDVTEQRASEAALRASEALARARADELAALMDAVPAAVWVAENAECSKVTGNRTGYSLLRVDRGQNLSKTAPDTAATTHFKVLVNNVEVPPQLLPLQRAARGVEVRDHEEDIVFEDGQVLHIFGTAVPLRDPAGAPRGAIGAFVYVTRLKRAEEAMRDADRRKDEFLALLSHELRNPLAPILTAAQLMQLRGDVATPREREVILRQAQHLIRLVDDLLDVSRAARGKVTLTKRRVELASVVAKAVEVAGPLLEQRRHQLHISVPAEGLMIEADEVRLTQVFNNLLTNAAHYTPPGGRVDVTAAREGDRVVLRVRDDGIGIDPGLLPQVFEMFVQGPRGSDRSEGGLGLGLSLSRTLVTLHGGTVDAASEGVGQGSEFTVRLPAAGAEVLAPPPRSLTPPPPRLGERAQRILVVDDNRDGAGMISDVLGGAGFDVKVAHDPSVALSMADGFRPQVAILDIGLPVMDGYALGRELRARLGGAAPILVALTGYGQEQDKRLSKAAGFVRHLVKPVDAEALLRTVTSLVEPPRA
jgi:PAS domain S-box-containing protein